MTIKEWLSDPKICTKERLAYFLKHAKKSHRFKRVVRKEKILLSFLEGRRGLVDLKEFEKGDYEVLGEEMAEVVVSHNPYRLNQVPLTPGSSRRQWRTMVMQIPPRSMVESHRHSGRTSCGSRSW